MRNNLFKLLSLVLLSMTACEDPLEKQLLSDLSEENAAIFCDDISVEQARVLLQLKAALCTIGSSFGECSVSEFRECMGDQLELLSAPLNRSAEIIANAKNVCEMKVAAGDFANCDVPARTYIDCYEERNLQIAEFYQSEMVCGEFEAELIIPCLNVEALCAEDPLSDVDDMAGETAGDMAGESAGSMAGETAGDMAGETAGSMAGETAGETAGESAGETAGETAGESAGETAGTEPMPGPPSCTEGLICLGGCAPDNSSCEMNCAESVPMDQRDDFNAYFECAENRGCTDRLCADEVSCRNEIQACAPVGEASCNDVLTCLDRCSSTNDECAIRCRLNGTERAQRDYGSLFRCVDTFRCTSPDCDRCIDLYERCTGQGPVIGDDCEPGTPMDCSVASCDTGADDAALLMSGGLDCNYEELNITWGRAMIECSELGPDWRLAKKGELEKLDATPDVCTSGLPNVWKSWTSTCVGQGRAWYRDESGSYDPRSTGNYGPFAKLCIRTAR